MSRDAKIGLLIVFAFMILFGTVLAHRLRSEGAKETWPDQGAIASELDVPTFAEDYAAERHEQPAGRASQPDTKTVDAVTVRVDPPASSVSSESAGMLPPGQFGSPETATREGGTQADSSAGAQILLSDAPSPPASDPAGSKPPHAESLPAAQQSSETASHQRSGNLLLQIPNHEAQPAGSSGPDTGQPGGWLELSDEGTEGARERSGEPAESPHPSEPPPDAAVRPAQSPAQTNRVQDAEADEFAAPPTSSTDTPADELPARNEPGFGGQQTDIKSFETAPADRSDTESPAAVAPENPQASYDSGRLDFSDPGASEQDKAINPIRSSDPWQPVRQFDSATRNEQRYVVQAGDSYWSISVQFYKSGRYFRQLEKYNLRRLEGAERESHWRRVLRPGDVVVLPDLAKLGLMSSPEGSGTNQENSVAEQSQDGPAAYRVKEGDTLTSISERMLGTVKRWKEIFELNRAELTDPHHLVPGTKLRLPVSRPEEKIAEEAYPRR